MKNTSNYRQSRNGSQSSNNKRSFKKSFGNSNSNNRNRNRKRSNFSSRGKSNFKSGGAGIRTRSGRRIPTYDPTEFIKRNTAEQKLEENTEKVEEIYEPKNTFDTFGLNKKLAEIVKQNGITIPSPIQDQVIPEIMEGHDVIGLAETGTGKTAAFLLPLIEKTLEDNNRQTLILTPTRELAIQIKDELHKFSKPFNIYSTTCVGGVNIRLQIKSLNRKNHFIIGTPGRILDLIERKNINPKQITTLVLDEADRMLDMGFIDPMRKIVSDIPKSRETLFFSATSSKETDGLTKEFLKDPITISVKKKDTTIQIEQLIINHDHKSKFNTLLEILKKEECKKVIIFGAMKHSVKNLTQDLVKSGISSESIHGNKTHVQRQRSLAKFKDSKVKVLVATDVAARGIHVNEVTHVINYDLPSTFQDYIHRIGRTGRAEKVGKALTFVSK